MSASIGSVRQVIAAGAAAALLAGLPLAAPAQPEDPPGDGGFLSVPDAPAPPPAYGGDSVSVPEVTIRETEREVIYEYRIRGQLYMVRVEPLAGPPYYLLDTDNDGVLDVQEDTPPDLAVPQWLLFSW